MNLNIEERDQEKQRRKILIDTQLTYEDLLAKMNMVVHNGGLYVNSNSSIVSHGSNKRINQVVKETHKYNNVEIPENVSFENNYIYNKYFKNNNNNNVEIQKPKTINDYKAFLLQKILNKRRLELIKSKKMMFQ